MNILGKTRVLGVFGHPISHSLSPAIHNAAIEAMGIDYVYVPFHVLPEDLERAVAGIRAMNIAGINVTIPHKESVIAYLDEVSERSMRIHSVNTIINRDGYLVGDTTDGPGFLKSAESEWGKLDGRRVLILGAGGSAKAVSFALAEIGCDIAIANRTPERATQLAEGLSSVFGRGIARAVEMDRQTLADEVKRADLLVNTTSVGMTPDIESVPIPAELLHPNLMVYDLVYNPPVTRLVSRAREVGARAVNGLGMLVHQGALSLEMWTGRQVPINVMEEAAAVVL
ncbi:shikimate dehydrogenase [bacterium]|nr:shikimate dehydrogenase [bacterium]